MKRMRSYRWHFWAHIIFVTALSGCNLLPMNHLPEHKRCEDGSVFRGEWHDFYNRGNCRYERQEYESSLEDYKSAIKLRTKDKWKARSYGMHFTDYFPSREMGITYYRLGEFPMAIEALEKSLHDEHSARAEFYLSKAREMNAAFNLTDGSGPTIESSSTSPIIFTNDIHYQLSVKLSDQNGIASITINEEQKYYTQARKNREEVAIVVLDPGLNAVHLSATDVFGNLTTKYLKIFLDLQRPNIILESVEIIGNDIVLAGRVSDQTGIASFSINGQDVTLPENRPNAGYDYVDNIETPFIFNLTKSVHDNSIEINVTDGAGNERTNGYLTDKLLSSNVNNTYTEKYAFLGDIFNGLAGFFYSDSNAPKIDFVNNSFSDNYLEIYKPYLVINVIANDERNNICHMNLLLDNQVQSKIFENKKCSEKSVKVERDALVKLKPTSSQQIIQVTAKDKLGNIGESEELVVKIVEHPLETRRMRVHLEHHDEYDNQILPYAILETKLKNAFAENGRFILETDEEKASDVTLKASVRQYPNDSGIEIGMEPLIGTLVAGSEIDVYTESITNAFQRETLDTLTTKLVTKVMQRFPIVRSKIIEKNTANEIVVGAGRKDGISLAHKFYFLCIDEQNNSCKKYDGILSWGNVTEERLKDSTSTTSLLQQALPPDIDMKNILVVTH